MRLQATLSNTKRSAKGLPDEVTVKPATGGSPLRSRNPAHCTFNLTLTPFQPAWAIVTQVGGEMQEMVCTVEISRKQTAERSCSAIHASIFALLSPQEITSSLRPCMTPERTCVHTQQTGVSPRHLGISLFIAGQIRCAWFSKRTGS